MAVSCEPGDLARLATCWCFPGNTILRPTALASAVEIYLLVAAANEGVPPQSGLELGDPDSDMVLGDPNMGIIFGEP